MLICRPTLKDFVDRAVQTTDAPHVNLAPLLGLSVPVRVGLDDVHALLDSEEPAVRLDVGPASVTVRRQDGGMLAELTLQW